MDALSSVNTDEPNVIRVSVASAQPIDGADRAVLVLEFTAADSASEDASARILSAQVDEQTARVVTKSDDLARIEDDLSRLDAGAP
jgi:hypothetical protein